MSLNDVVTLNISRSAAAVSRQGFGTMLILGPNAQGWSSDRIRTYTSAAAMLDDGFSSSDPEYKAAVAAFSQQVKPTRVKVGRSLTAVAQVDTMTPDVSTQAIQHYIVTINGTAYDFTSDADPTATEVVTGLKALINADSACAVAATGTTTLILTAKQAGIGFTATGSANLANVHTTPNTGVASDLPAIALIDDDWYALVLTSRDNEEILEAAAYIESVRKVFVTCTGDAAVIAAGSTDIASRLKAKGYARTAYIYSGDNAHYPDAAWLGTFLPLDPGAYTAKFKTLAGVTVDSGLTQTQVTVATGKNANTYTPVGGINITSEGVMASGEFIDVIVGIDWIYATMQADIYQVLVDRPKVPFTDKGIALIESKVANVLTQAVAREILTDSPAPTVTVPKAADLDKSTRRLTGLSFVGYLAGAVHAVTVNGSVLV